MPPTIEKLPRLDKVLTGITGLDDITNGGLPKGRPTLIYGGAGSGKTLMGMEFLARGAIQFGEPGVFMSFEESENELITNVASLGFDLKQLIKSKKLFIDYVSIERSEIEETGDYNLDGLFVRLNNAIDTVKAKRVVLDTIEVLFAGLKNEAIIRAELRRLFRWLKDRGVTTVVTGERSSTTGMTRHGLEEYVSDCVIFLDNRIDDELSTRRLRIMKYRGSSHSSNEFPFLIDSKGISLLPVTTLKLEYPVSTERISSGIFKLDEMLGGKGYIRGTSVLVSGMVGTGKTTLAAHLVNSACQRGESCLYYAFEEAPEQIMRNMRSIGIDLEPWVKKGMLHFHAVRVSEQGLEKHLLTILATAEKFNPNIVIIDALSDFVSLGPFNEVRQMALRIVDFFKTKQVTTMFTSMSPGQNLEETGVGLSSAFDTWIHLNNIQGNQERNRTLVIVKSRGMAHSNQVREFVMDSSGVDLVDIYAGQSGAFMGSARVTQMAIDRAADVARAESVTWRERQIKEKRRALESRIAALRAETEAEIKEAEIILSQEHARDKTLIANVRAQGKSRSAKR